MSDYLLIYGAGGFAREVAWLAEAGNTSGAESRVLAFIDDDESTHGSIIDDIPVMSLESAREAFPAALIISGVGSPRAREATMRRASTSGASFGTLIHPGVLRSRRVTIGDGVIVCAGTILTTNISLGRHVQINLGCTIGHDVVMGDYSTLAPGVHLSGFVHIGKRSYVGTGAVILNGTDASPLVIGDDAVVGAGACVTKSVPSGTTVVGVPAKPIR